MQLFRRHVHPSVWLALVALVLAAVAPVLAHAFNDGARTTWVEICTAQGAKWVPIAQSQAGDGKPAPLSTHGAIDHCPYCTLQATPALLSRDDAATPAVLSDAPPATQPSPPPSKSLAWQRAQPRGPPHPR